MDEKRSDELFNLCANNYRFGGPIVFEEFIIKYETREIQIDDNERCFLITFRNLIQFLNSDASTRIQGFPYRSVKELIEDSLYYASSQSGLREKIISFKQYFNNSHQQF